MTRLLWFPAPRSDTQATDPFPLYPSSGPAERCLDLVFPPVCAGCRRIGRWICAGCWSEMPWMHDWTCGQCGKLSATPQCELCLPARSSLDQLVSVAAFEGPAREAIHAFKFNGLHGMSTTMGKIMGACASSIEVDAVVHVPLHASRRRERGYDQSALLARAAARQLGLRWMSKALVRTRRTAQQARLSAEQRSANVAGAFEARLELHGERLLLVDDVSTTGATLRSAASALQQAGSGPISSLVFAKAL